MLNPTGEENSKLISILPEVSTWSAREEEKKRFSDSRQTGDSATRFPRSRQETLHLVLYPNNGHRPPPGR